MQKYDRKISSEPQFEKKNLKRLLKDLEEYLKTLRSVHTGDDFTSAAENFMGYSRSTLKGRKVEVEGIQSPISEKVNLLLEYLTTSLKISSKAEASSMAESKLESDEILTNVLEFLHAATDCRAELHNLFRNCADAGERLSDMLFLDLALDSCARQQCERYMQKIRLATRNFQFRILIVMLRNVILSSGHNTSLINCHTDLSAFQESDLENGNARERLYAITQRLTTDISDRCETTLSSLDWAARSLVDQLHVRKSASEGIKESIIRSDSAAVLAQIISCIQPNLINDTESKWSVISKGTSSSLVGRVIEVDTLSNVNFEEPTILLMNGPMDGNEDM